MTHVHLYIWLCIIFPIMFITFISPCIIILTVYELLLYIDFNKKKSKIWKRKTKKLSCSISSQDSDVLSSKDSFDVEPLHMKIN